MSNIAITQKQTSSKQHGFSLIEILIVLTITSVLVGVVISMGSSASGGVAHKQVREELGQFFPIAIKNCLTRTRGDLSNCTTAKIQTVSISPLSSTTTPCGDTWSAVATAPSVVVTYPLDQCVDNDDFGNALATQLTAEHKINATYNAGTDDMSVTYLR